MYMLPSLILSLLLCLYSCTATLYNSTIAEVIPQLFASFPDVGEYSARLTKDYTYGRQDMGKCCALAVLESFVEYNDTVTLANDSFIGDDLDGFRRHPRPCTASYIVDRTAAPPVHITYGWCSSHCPGWQRSKNKKLNQWVLPILGFIVPSVVFCLSIPRRWKIKIPDELFNVPLNAMTSAPRTPFIALLAMLLVSIDTIVWLMTVFALAGPILVSGIYEASIDSRILAYLQEKIRNHQLSVFQRAQLMYVVLVGNLDMLAFPPGGDDHDTLLNHIEGPEGLLQRLIPRENKKIVAKSISTTKTRLNALLFVQYDFGVTVGAPVVFFCGSFLYTLFDNFAHVGDNDVGHAIAFGTWFMTIAHIAIVSGLLLAGNNPKTLEGIVGMETVAEEAAWWGFVTRFYNSRYNAASMWNRGRSKRIWVLRTIHYSRTPPNHLQESLDMKMNDWVTVAVCASVLIGTPCVLAFLTSYFTPQVGLSCRSMTFLLYVLCQIWLILLWIWNIESTYLDGQGIPYTPVTRSIYTSFPRLALWQACLWKPQILLACGVSIFTGIGGTLMQVIGVYRNCLCAINVGSWGASRFTARFVISPHSAEAIYSASTVWRGTSIAAITFLGVVTFVGWWYQRRLREQFRIMINQIDENVEGGQEDFRPKT